MQLEAVLSKHSVSSSLREELLQCLIVDPRFRLEAVAATPLTSRVFWRQTDGCIGNPFVLHRIQLTEDFGEELIFTFWMRNLVQLIADQYVRPVYHLTKGSFLHRAETNPDGSIWLINSAQFWRQSESQLCENAEDFLAIIGLHCDGTRVTHGIGSGARNMTPVYASLENITPWVRRVDQQVT